MIISESKTEKYYTEVLKGNVSIFSDAPEDKGGKGQYLNPSDLLCASFASCLNITARIILGQEKINYEKVVVKVNLDSSDEYKTKILYDVDILGDISIEDKKNVVEKLRDCPIRNTLSKEIQFETMQKV